MLAPLGFLFLPGVLYVLPLQVKFKCYCLGKVVQTVQSQAPLIFPTISYPIFVFFITFITTQNPLMYMFIAHLCPLNAAYLKEDTVSIPDIPGTL